MIGHVGGPQVDVLQLAPLLAAAVMYGLRARTLSGDGRAVPVWRQASWYAGLLLIALTLSSPLGHLAGELFVAHMTEHLLIAEVGSLLLVLGLTGPVLVPILRVPWLRWLERLAQPVPAFVLWAANLVFWHLAGPHEAALRTDAIHALQHMCFVGFAFNAWMALLGPLPKPAWFGNWAKLGYIVALRLFGTLVANVFVWTGQPLYDAYRPGERYWSIDPLSDQVAAGSVMMVEGSIVTLCVLCWLFLRAGREEDEATALDELAVARGVDLPAGRAARAVAAGRGDELRARIESQG
ncbi:MAG: cytochrome c oxidase assembly protein [Solirubrobacteraceae bacterium]|nr:cytochrome c oxidase assembly protein [Solirubrobacteraceae bacterium]